MFESCRHKVCRWRHLCTRSADLPINPYLCFTSSTQPPFFFSTTSSKSCTGALTLFKTLFSENESGTRKVLAENTPSEPARG